jgi:DNA-binding CsgD family transcriptional regulator
MFYREDLYFFLLMYDFADIINSRSIPGVLIIDSGSRLRYANREALGIIPELRDCTPGEAEISRQIPDEIAALCALLRTGNPATVTVQGKMWNREIFGQAGAHCALRAFFIDNPGEGEDGQHIMVLVERVVERHEVNFKRAQKDYLLSKREVEILQCICSGLTNREIAEVKFISEYTVKDHVKKIMRNMGVSSRSEILAALR